MATVDSNLQWPVDDFTKFRRFLCMGNEVGRFSIDAKDPNPRRTSVSAMKRLIDQGMGQQVVQEIVTFSKEDRTAKQTPVIYALAICCKDPDIKDEQIKRSAYKALGTVCQIPTQLFEFVHFCQKIVREHSENKKKPVGWGRASRKAVSDWYNNKEHMTLALHVTKYIQRHRWSHKDIMRLAHVKPRDTAHAMVQKYVAKGYKVLEEDLTKNPPTTDEEKLLAAYLKAVHVLKHTTDEIEAAHLVGQYQLVKEQIPTWFANSKMVWGALLDDMPFQSMIKSLGKMTAIGLLDSMSVDSKSGLVIKRLKDNDLIATSKIHPFQLLLAYQTYKSGKGEKGKLTWTVNEEIVGALNDAFYLSFKNIRPTGKRYLLALDASGSMQYGSVEGSPQVTPAMASAAMAMILQRTESNAKVVAFAKDSLEEVDIKPTMELEKVLAEIAEVKMGATDAAVPIQWAMSHKQEVDVFVMFTDCHTFPGQVTPAQALKQYRQSMGLPHARLVVVALASSGNDLNLADPKDAGMLDIAGFDASVPALIQDFVRGVIESQHNDDPKSTA